MAELEKGQLKRTAVTFGGMRLAWLTFQSLGIIYSDIGTSPLYTLNSIWPSSAPAPSTEDIIGGLSALIWSLTLIPLTKYVFICLQFGTHEGEGGTFALYQGLYPPTPLDFDADRTLTGDSGDYKVKSTPKTGRALGETVRWPLLVWCLFGTSLTIADGVLTPAVSVTSAVSGIGVAQPSVVNDVIPISIGILIVFFLCQRFGTAKVGTSFAPIACVWFALLAVTGAYNISYYPGIFRAFDPSRAVLWFVRTQNYDLLTGVLLAVTGCEAVFANLGQFNALSIRLSFCFLVYPSLVLAYLGQGAALINNGDYIITNVFYNSIPGPQGGPLFWIMFVVALLATIIASQAMVSGTFSLVQQLVNMKILPPIRLNYTSETLQGQIYVPVVNYGLMIACVTIVGAFQSPTGLTNAYGFAVATVMFSTTWLIAIQMYYVKGWPWIIGVAFLLVFGFFDGLFWGASLKKIPQGAWVPLMLGLVVLIFMLFWTWARRLEDNFDASNRHNLRHFIHVDEKNAKLTISVDKDSSVSSKTTKEHHMDAVTTLPSLTEDDAQPATPNVTYYLPKQEKDQEGIESEEERRELVRIPTCAVFHKLTIGRGVPHSFVGFIKQWPAIPEIVIFLAVAVLPINRVPEEDRFVVEKVRSVDGFYGCTYYLGFRDAFDIKIEDLVTKICDIEMRNPTADLQTRLARIRRVATKSTHIVPHYRVVSKDTRQGRIGSISNWIRRFVVEGLYQRLVTMFPETLNWRTPADQIIHVGINALI